MALTKAAVTPAPTASPGPPLDAFDVFISYSHAEDDKKWVMEELEPFLIKNECRVCRDDQIPGGEHWRIGSVTRSRRAATWWSS